MSKKNFLRIATRKSPLAFCQAEIVKNRLLHYYPDLQVEFVPVVTSGDKNLAQSLATVCGKGLFIKELQQALLANEADMAVHSLKDIPAESPEMLVLTAFLEREDPRDVFISASGKKLLALPAGASVGTASIRRQALLRHLRPDLQIKTLRGNVNTRLSKLDKGEYHALVLAAAGLHRLGIDNRITHYFSPEESLPAIGQGVIVIECRRHDVALRKRLALLDHTPTRFCVQAERSMNQLLGGSCRAPVAGYATSEGNTLFLRGGVYAPDGSQIILSEASAPTKEAKILGRMVANKLLEKGAKDILASLQ